MTPDQRKMSEEEARREWAAEVARMRRAQEFLAGKFWQEDLRPYLEDHKFALGVGALWQPRPGVPTDPASVGMLSAFNGGRKVEIEELYKELNEWIEKGMLALKKLKERGIEA